MDLVTGPRSGPIDEQGRLLHEDDAAAQLALAASRLEDALASEGRSPHDLAGLRVLTTDRATVLDVLDVLVERLEALGVSPGIAVDEVGRLDVPGMLLALEPSLTTAVPPDPHVPLDHERPNHEGSTMTTSAPASPTASPQPDTATDALRGLCDGRVHLPGDPAYDVHRVPWNLAVDQRPAAVAFPHTVSDVQDVVRAAGAAGLRVAPQSTGHGAGPLGERSLADVVLLRLSRLTGVTVDPERRTARVVGGTVWQDVVAAAAPHGLTAPHGSAPDVAVAGYTLNGGLSFYGRRHGLAVNRIRAVEVVVADGSLVRADAYENAELFWAVRGGAANLGVVVSIELDLLPYADVFAGMLLWDRERASEVLPAWVRWTREVPESVTTSMRVMSFPPLPELPPFLSGRDLVVIDGAVLEDDQRAAELLAPLRALAPEMDTFGRMPVTGLLDVHMDPPTPVPAVSDHSVLGDLGDEAVDEFLAQVGPGTASGLLFAELRHLGGALARPAAGGGALSHLTGDYGMYCIAMAPTPQAAAAGAAAAAGVVRALAPWSLPSRIPTFTDTREDTSSMFDPEAWAALARIRDAHDPTRLFVANHEV
jgi:FAD/FMN-containing dehydrogenase/enamine deaminase RidA (YjgF/YER057c/UK114 family)